MEPPADAGADGPAMSARGRPRTTTPPAAINSMNCFRFTLGRVSGCSLASGQGESWSANHCVGAEMTTVDRTVGASFRVSAVEGQRTRMRLGGLPSSQPKNEAEVDWV